MSKLAPFDDDARPQGVLPIVAASDAGRRGRRRKAAPRPRRPPPPLRFGEWVISLTAWNGDRFISDFKGTYAEVCMKRDQSLATGRYEKAWIRSKV